MKKENIKKAHDVAKKMLQGKSGEYMKEKYGERAKEVAYATATKQQKNESVDVKEYYKEKLYNLFEQEQNSDMNSDMNSDVMYVDTKTKNGTTMTGAFNTAGMDKTDTSTQQGLNAVKKTAASGNMATASKVHKFVRTMDKVRQDDAMNSAVDPTGL